MRQDRGRFELVRIALAALLATGAAAAAANVLVVRAIGPSASTYPPGRSLQDNARIQLVAGDTLVVLGASGTRTFRGPGRFSPSGPAQPGPPLALDANTRARIAAVRGSPFVPSARTATIWQVDPRQSGNVCLVPANGIELWRANSTRTEALTITGPDGRVQLLWPAGQAIIDWPSGVSVRDDTEYQVRASRSPVAGRIRVRTIDTPPDNVVSVAEALISNGCDKQLELLVATQQTF